MSAFALPIPPAALASRLRRPTERSATAPEDRRRTTDDGYRHLRISDLVGQNLIRQALQHPRDHLILVAPPSPCRLVDIAEIKGIAQPYPHLVRRTDRHPDKAGKLRFSSPSGDHNLRPGWRRWIWMPAGSGRPE